MRGVATLSVCLLVVGCSGSAEPRSVRENQDWLTHEQVLDTEKETVYEAVAQLRPHWLSERGVPVFRNGVELGNLEELRFMSVATVARVGFSRAAHRTFGGRISGRILVYTRLPMDG